MCYHCKDLWHPDQTCDSARQQRVRSMFAMLREVTTRAPSIDPATMRGSMTTLSLDTALSSCVRSSVKGAGVDEGNTKAPMRGMGSLSGVGAVGSLGGGGSASVSGSASAAVAERARSAAVERARVELESVRAESAERERDRERERDVSGGVSVERMFEQQSVMQIRAFERSARFARFPTPSIPHTHTFEHTSSLAHSPPRRSFGRHAANNTC